MSEDNYRDTTVYESEKNATAILPETLLSCRPIFRYTHQWLMEKVKKSKVYDIAVRRLTCHTATGTHMPYRITQCYLPPDRGGIPAFTPAEAGTRLSDPGGVQRWVDLVGLLHTEMVYPPEDSHQSKY